MNSLREEWLTFKHTYLEIKITILKRRDCNFSEIEQIALLDVVYIARSFPMKIRSNCFPVYVGKDGSEKGAARHLVSPAGCIVNGQIFRTSLQPDQVELIGNSFKYLKIRWK